MEPSWTLPIDKAGLCVAGNMSGLLANCTPAPLGGEPSMLENVELCKKPESCRSCVAEELLPSELAVVSCIGFLSTAPLAAISNRTSRYLLDDANK